MMVPNRRTFIFAAGAAGLCIVLAAAAVSVGASPAGGDPHKTEVVSRDAAREILASVLPVEARQLEYDGTRDRPGERVHSFSGPDVRGAVDVFDGHIAILSLAVPTSKGDALLTPEQAEEAARAFLATLKSPVDGLTVTVSPETGAGIPGYTVRFVHWAGDVILPDYRVVQVDGVSGRVFSVVDVRRPYDKPPAPRVTSAEAEASAVERVSGKSTSGAQLIITFDAQGAQRLVWAVQVESTESGAPGAIVGIDAITGAPYDLAAR